MYGLRILAVARASRTKRSRTMRDVMSSAAKILTATRLPMSIFSASYTAAIPPRPISLVMRNFPSRTVPMGTLDLFLEGIAEAARAVAGYYTCGQRGRNCFINGVGTVDAEGMAGRIRERVCQ